MRPGLSSDQKAPDRSRKGVPAEEGMAKQSMSRGNKTRVSTIRWRLQATVRSGSRSDPARAAAATHSTQDSYCGHCGNPVEPDATFCGACGRPVVAEAAQPHPHSHAGPEAQWGAASPPPRFSRRFRASSGGRMMPLLSHAGLTRSLPRRRRSSGQPTSRRRGRAAQRPTLCLRRSARASPR